MLYCGAITFLAFLCSNMKKDILRQQSLGQSVITTELIPASSWSAGKAAALSHAKAAEACLKAWERRVAAFLLRAKTSAPLVFLSSLCTSLQASRSQHLPAQPEPQVSMPSSTM